MDLELSPYDATQIYWHCHTPLGHDRGHRMARKVRHSALESRTARLKLAVRRKPYSGPSLARGVSLLYRRNKGGGAWIAKVSDGHGNYWTKGIATADDYDDSDGKIVLDFWQAQDV